MIKANVKVGSKIICKCAQRNHTRLLVDLEKGKVYTLRGRRDIADELILLEEVHNARYDPTGVLDEEYGYHACDFDVVEDDWDE